MKKNKVFIIAEAGVNHNGSLEIAEKMIDAAVRAGCDAIKFQTFKAENIVTRSADKAEYQKDLGNSKESQFEMLKKLELDIEGHKRLLGYCRKKGIIFLSAPFDLESIDMLDELGLDTFKVPSGEITNLPYLKKIGALKKKVILSTGASDLREVEDAFHVLRVAGTPRENITILQCNTEYPTPHEDVNLKAMSTIRESLDVNVGYSDHTINTFASSAAVAAGASIVEKHFTLDKNMSGPDHKASLDPEELEAMVKAIRRTEKILGSGEKVVSPSEFKNKDIVRKSIVAAVDISAGDAFQENNIMTKRPGVGISPMKWDNVIGKHAKRNFKKDDLIEL